MATHTHRPKYRYIYTGFRLFAFPLESQRFLSKFTFSIQPSFSFGHLPMTFGAFRIWLDDGWFSGFILVVCFFFRTKSHKAEPTKRFSTPIGCWRFGRMFWSIVSIVWDTSYRKLTLHYVRWLMPNRNN